jgi:hypothetical protein
MKRLLEYRITRAADGRPLVQLDSPMGNGQEIRPDALRRLAAELSQIADEAEAKSMGRGYIASTGKTEY